jgi:hypothetical protein
MATHPLSCRHTAIRVSLFPSAIFGSGQCLRGNNCEDCIVGREQPPPFFLDKVFSIKKRPHWTLLH